jgi:hypothetical protein
MNDPTDFPYFRSRCRYAIVRSAFYRTVIRNAHYRFIKQPQTGGFAVPEFPTAHAVSISSTIFTQTLGILTNDVGELALIGRLQVFFKRCVGCVMAAGCEFHAPPP